MSAAVFSSCRSKASRSAALGCGSAGNGSGEPGAAAAARKLAVEGGRIESPQRPYHAAASPLLPAASYAARRPVGAARQADRHAGRRPRASRNGRAASLDRRGSATRSSRTTIRASARSPPSVRPCAASDAVGDRRRRPGRAPRAPAPRARRQKRSGRTAPCRRVGEQSSGRPSRSRSCGANAPLDRPGRDRAQLGRNARRPRPRREPLPPQLDARLAERPMRRRRRGTTCAAPPSCRRPRAGDRAARRDPRLAARRVARRGTPAPRTGKSAFDPGLADQRAAGRLAAALAQGGGECGCRPSIVSGGWSLEPGDRPASDARRQASPRRVLRSEIWPGQSGLSRDEGGDARRSCGAGPGRSRPSTARPCRAAGSLALVGSARAPAQSPAAPPGRRPGDRLCVVRRQRLQRVGRARQAASKASDGNPTRPNATHARRSFPSSERLSYGEGGRAKSTDTAPAQARARPSDSPHGLLLHCRRTGDIGPAQALLPASEERPCSTARLSP